jgi:beta-N-acetylhexosaminidase
MPSLFHTGDIPAEQPRREILAGLVALLTLWTVRLYPDSVTRRHTDDSSIESQIDAMRSDQRVAQLLLVGFDEPQIDSDLREMVSDWGVGGVIFYKRNIAGGRQTRELVRQIRGLAEDAPAPFIAIDQESGSVTRLNDTVPELPGNMALGATRCAELAEEASYATGTALQDLGFTMNLAPVLDVLREPTSALGTRSFGSDPVRVAEMGNASIRGYIKAGVMPVAKHFIGEGSAPGDSHHANAAVWDQASVVRANDLLPFQAALDAGLPAVMTSHVAIPALTGDEHLSVTHSKAVLRDLLRDELGFDGIVITDALEMRGAAVGRMPVAERAVAAIEAGADMVISAGSASDRRSIYQGLREAYACGRLTEERLRESLRRILRAKAHLRPHITSGSRPSQLAGIATLAERIAQASITLIHDRGKALPIHAEGTRSVAYVGPAGLLASYPHVISYPLPPSPQPHEMAVLIRHALQAIGDPHVIIVACRNRRQAQIADRIVAARPKSHVVAISLGNPHDLEALSRADTVIAAYSDIHSTQAALLSLLLGSQAAQGTLPVQLARIPLPIPGPSPLSHETGTAVAVPRTPHSPVQEDMCH